MTQLFTEQGKVVPVTVVEAMPNTVTALKTLEKDGYSAIQISSEDQNIKRANKAQISANGGKAFKIIQEVRLEDAPTATIGDVLDVTTFIVGDDVVVTGISKSKGFQGVVKRHGFAGGPRTHGQKHSEREPGSIGGGPGRAGGRVVKGMRMAGRTGGDKVSVKGLKVAGVDAERNLLYVKGALPGRRGTILKIVG